jgi:2-dehydropantoate 2-reductase
MKIAIIGAGAIGGLVGAKLAAAGESVTFIARRRHVEAIRANGLRLVAADGTEQVTRDVRATDDYAAAGMQDIVILAMKANQVEDVLADLPRLLGPDTVVVPMQNGIPYWYFQKHGGPFEGTRVASVDPHGRIAASIAPERVVGCVVYPASQLQAPGVVRHIEGERFPLGELDGAATGRVQRIAAAFTQDVEAGREPEIDALVGSVVELARLTDTPTPHIDTVYALVKLLARTMQAQRGQVRLVDAERLAA